MKYTVVLKIATALLAASSADAYDSLKSRAGNFRIGVATDSSRFNNWNYVNAMSNFNYMVAENACKMAYIQPQRGVYNFGPCDTHLNKAKEYGMAFRGHALVWHSMPPNWFKNLRGNDLKNAMVDHITKTLKHYEGKIDTWDVVNEAIDDSSNQYQWKYRQSFLYNNVPNFVELAFKTARQVSPRTKLFYNDYNTEGIYSKSEAVYNFVRDMRSKGVPIDGVGLQYHVSVSAYPQFNNINNLIGRYCKLGVEVHITEIDVKANGNSQKQATVYSEALKACLNNSCCKAYLVWGVGDNDSWLGSNATGLLFDGNYQPKAAYNALLQTLGGGHKSYSPYQQSQGNNKSKSGNGKTNQKKQNNGKTNNKKTNKSSNGQCAALWMQCGGGPNYRGPTCCQKGKCVTMDTYFKQCRP